MFTDMSKLFNTEDMMKTMQKSWDVQSFTKNQQQSMDALQQATTVMTETMTNCMEKCMSMSQTAMQESIDAAKELSSAKDIEEYMSKQTTLSQKASTAAQKRAQELAKLMQDSQKKCVSVLSKNAQTFTQSTGSSASK